MSLPEPLSRSTFNYIIGGSIDSSKYTGHSTQYTVYEDLVYFDISITIFNIIGLGTLNGIVSVEISNIIGSTKHYFSALNMTVVYYCFLT